jgi:hypothetical protein
MLPGARMTANSVGACKRRIGTYFIAPAYSRVKTIEAMRGTCATDRSHACSMNAMSALVAIEARPRDERRSGER